MNKKAINIFNEKLKQDFINSEIFSDSTSKRYLSIFNRTARWEYQLQQDLCCIKDISILQKIFDDVSGINYRSAYTIKSSIKRYCKWCVDNNVPGSINIVDDIVIEQTNTFAQTMVQDPLHLQKFLNVVFDDEDKNTIDNTYRCLYWLSYAGLRCNDAINVKTNDVDFVTMSVKYQGKSYPLYKEGLKSFHKCVELSSFIHYHGTYESNMSRFSGDKLLRGIKSDMQIVTVSGIISRRINKSSDIKITFEKARISGIFYRMYEQEVFGVQLDFRNIAENYMTDKKYNASSKHSMQKIRNAIAVGTKEDYAKWKEAFSLK